MFEPHSLCYLYYREQETWRPEIKVHTFFDPTLHFTFSDLGVIFKNELFTIFH